MKAATNVARNYVASSYARRTVGLDDDRPASAESPIDAVYRKEMRRWYDRAVGPAVAALPETYRHAIEVYTNGEKPYRVAQQEAIPMSTLRSRYKAAVKLLRERAAESRAP